MVDVAFLHDVALPEVNDTLPLVPALPAHVDVEELVAHGHAALAGVSHPENHPWGKPSRRDPTVALTPAACPW